MGEMVSRLRIELADRVGSDVTWTSARALLVVGLLIGAVPPQAWGQPVESGTPSAAESATPAVADRTIARALRYLAKQQQEDGSTGSGILRGNVAVTALAGLAMLADGSTPNEGRYRDNLRNGMRYVMSTAKDGYLGDAGATQGNMYAHAFATMFLARYLQVTPKDNRVRPLLEQSVRRAVKVIVDAQHDQGGWRYLPVKSRGDVTSSSCQILALATARKAGIEIPEKSFELASHFLISCQNADGGFSYMSVGGGDSNFCRTAACANSLYLAGTTKGKYISDALRYLNKQRAPRLSEPYFFFGAFFMSQVMAHDRGDSGDRWRSAIAKRLADAQRDDGSWNGPMNCPELSTAMACLVLQSRPVPEAE